MDEKLLDDWIAALRSGEYKQGFGDLKQGEAYCCLGVKGEVAGRHNDYPENGMDYRFCYSGAYKNELWKMNDGVNSSRYNFNQIADFIEAHRQEFLDTPHAS